MPVMRVNFGALQTGSGDIRTTHANLQSMFSDLQTQVNQLLPTWDGEARNAYLALQTQWNQLNQLLNDNLRGMGTGVDTAHDNFVRAETTNVSGWM
jgi:6 kDa early secretory antigenic target